MLHIHVKTMPILHEALDTLLTLLTCTHTHQTFLATPLPSFHQLCFFFFFEVARWIKFSSTFQVCNLLLLSLSAFNIHHCHTSYPPLSLLISTSMCKWCELHIMNLCSCSKLEDSKSFLSKSWHLKNCSFIDVSIINNVGDVPTFASYGFELAKPRKSHVVVAEAVIGWTVSGWDIPGPLVRTCEVLLRVLSRQKIAANDLLHVTKFAAGCCAA